MMTLLTITAKGQVTLKKDVLRHLGVKPGDKIDVDLLPDGRLELAAATKQSSDGRLDSFFNSLSNDHNVHSTLDEINEAIEAGWAGERGL